MALPSRARMRRAWLFFILISWWLFVGAHCASISEYGTGTDHDVDDPTTERQITSEQLKDQTKVANYVAVAGLTLYAWEYLCTFPNELTMWFHPRRLVRPQVFLFLAIRYVTVPALAVPLYSLWGDIHDQSDCPKHEQITVAVVQFVVSCIFSWRTIAIWRRRRWVTVFLLTFSLLLFVTSLSLLYFSKDAYIVTGQCRPALGLEIDNDHKDPSKRPVNTVQWFYLTCIVFDTVILVLSTYKLLVYANMGRAVNTVSFRDPFEAHRQQLEKQAAAQNESPDVEAALNLAPSERRPSHATMILRGLRSSMVSLVLFPYRKASALYSWWSSLTPLVARLMGNGVLYFIVATAYSVNNFALEAVLSLHSKSFLTLYPPLMCVLCQRMLLTEFAAVWSPHDEDNFIPGRDLVNAVTGAKRRAKAQSDIDRFEFFASRLEERHASIVSPRSHQPSRDPPPGRPSQGPSEPPVLSTYPSYMPPESKDSDLSASDDVPPETSGPLGQAEPSIKMEKEPASETPSTRPPSPSPNNYVPPAPPQVARHRPIQLTQVQQEQALRMAGFS